MYHGKKKKPMKKKVKTPKKPKSSYKKLISARRSGY